MNFYTDPQKTRITENIQENHSVSLASPKNRFNERFALLLKSTQTIFFLSQSISIGQFAEFVIEHLVGFRQYVPVRATDS